MPLTYFKCVDTLLAYRNKSIPEEPSLWYALAANADEHKTGKRIDHDSLPDEIKAKYVENLSILQRMRELHLKLRSLSLDTSPCPDSERYPFLKELINLDKKMHANWEEYDHFVASAPSAKAAAKPKARAKK